MNVVSAIENMTESNVDISRMESMEILGVIKATWFDLAVMRLLISQYVSLKTLAKEDMNL